jgi:ABC-type Na+ efflux pump permease subunit
MLILLVSCLALMALKFAVIALALALLLTVLWGAFAHPAETFGTLLFFLVARIAMTHGAAALAVAGVLVACFLLRRPDKQTDAILRDTRGAEDGSSGAPVTPVDKK